MQPQPQPQPQRQPRAGGQKQAEPKTPPTKKKKAKTTSLYKPKTETNTNTNTNTETQTKTKTRTKTKEEEQRERERESKLSSSSPPPPLSPAAASCSFPMSRVKRLVRSENPATTRTTPDAVFLINKASEIFLERFAEDAYARATKERKKSIDYKHLSSTVYNAKRYEFLSDFVPEKVKVEDALRTRVS